MAAAEPIAFHMFTDTNCKQGMKKVPEHYPTTDCYKVPPGHKAVILNRGGQIYYDDSCQTHGQGYAEEHECRGFTGGNDVRGVKIFY